MLRLHHVVAAIGLPLLFAGCGEDTAPPSSPTTEPALGPAARVAAPVVDRFHYQLRQTVANSSFSSFDPSGCVETFVLVPFEAGQRLTEAHLQATISGFDLAECGLLRRARPS
jgi:hypothetical protein